MIKAVIFDVDGTLIDSVDLHAQAWLETLRDFGKDATFAEVRAQIGKGGDQLMPVFWSAEEIEQLEEAITKRRSAIFQEKYVAQVKGFPDVRPLFERILREGKRIALASSAQGDELQDYQRRADIVGLLDAETSSDDAEKSKPYPDIFEAALARLKNPAPEETLVIGDTPYDIEAARQAGLRTIAVRCGGFSEDSLQGAIAIFDDPADLLAHYERSPLFNG